MKARKLTFPPALMIRDSSLRVCPSFRRDRQRKVRVPEKPLGGDGEPQLSEAAV
jgi:hypothetical protein